MSARCEKHNHGPSMHPCPECSFTPKTPPLTREEIQRMREMEEKARSDAARKWTEAEWDAEWDSIQAREQFHLEVIGNVGRLLDAAEACEKYLNQNTMRVFETGLHLLSIAEGRDSQITELAEERDRLAERVRELEAVLKDLIDAALHTDWDYEISQDPENETPSRIVLSRAREALKGKGS